MNKTKIEWVKNPDGTQGYTWNPITGCLNGCEYCYARRLANGRLRSRYLDNPNIALPAHLEGKDLHSEDVWEYQKDPFYPRFWESRMPEPDHNRMIWKGVPIGVFVCDMSDLFGIGIPDEWTQRVLDVIKSQPWHRFYLLTKQAQNLSKWSPFPENVYLGVSVTNQKMFDDAVKYLRQVEATVKFISFEPLLERIKLDIIG